VWLDGGLRQVADAWVSPYDHGLLVGDGVFETLRLYGGRPFALRRHLERLERSAAGLELAVPERAVLEGAVAEVVAANAMEAARLRITLTSGPGPLGSARGGGQPTVIVAMAPLVPLPDAYPVALAPWPRNERGAVAGLKTLSYAENVVALAWAARQGAVEAVFANLAGNLCEGTATNVFVGIGGRLVTPPLSSGCLAGVTRELVVELTGAVEEDLPAEALAAADEAFLTGTGCEVKPVSAVDGLPLGSVPGSVPGPLTKAAATAFAALVAADTDP
jgi:branched-chain amino acid aminotransferase